MIRFIKLEDQICPGYFAFAFYCTVKDEFKTFSGSSQWGCLREFITDWANDFTTSPMELQRYLRLVPEGEWT